MPSSSPSAPRAKRRGGGAAAQRNSERTSLKQQKPSNLNRQRPLPSSSSSSSSSSHSPSSDYIDDFHEEAAAERSQLLSESLSQAEELMGQADFSSALSLLAPLLSSHPSSAPLHDAVAQCFLAEADIENATFHLTTSCSLAPSDNPVKWMYLAQIKGGMEAIEAFQRGIDIYQQHKIELKAKGGDAEMREGKNGEDRRGTAVDDEEEDDGNDAVIDISHSLSSAYVSMAELYVTDLCDEADAEQRCEELLGKAIEEWPDNPEALYAYANLNLIRGEEAQAKQWMERSIEAIQRAESFDTARQPALSVLLSSASTSSSPSYELRLNLAKLAYEVGEWVTCSDLLEKCLEEDDSFIEVVHLAALGQMQQGRWTQAREYAERAREMIEKAKQAGANPSELRGMTKAINEVVAQCEGKEDVEVEGAEDEEGMGEEEDAGGEEDKGGDDEDEEEEHRAGHKREQTMNDE